MSGNDYGERAWIIQEVHSGTSTTIMRWKYKLSWLQVQVVQNVIVELSPDEIEPIPGWNQRFLNAIIFYGPWALRLRKYTPALLTFLISTPCFQLSKPLRQQTQEIKSMLLLA
jgi:hypothetical protein